jgi:hypothetical protein
MPLPRTAADVLADHVAFEVEEIDRVYLNVWQPGCSMARGGVASPRTARTGMRPGSEHTEHGQYVRWPVARPQRVSGCQIRQLVPRACQGQGTPAALTLRSWAGPGRL